MAAVDYTNAETLSRVQTWLSLPLTQKRSAEGLNQLAALYSITSGSAAGECKQCQYSDFNRALVAYERHSLRLLNPDLMANAQYSLASGYENQEFVHDSFNGVVTAENLTDKAAEFFIEKGFGPAFLKNGKPLPTEADTQTEPAAPKLTEKQQAQADYEAAFGFLPDAALTIAQLKEKTAEKVAENEKARD